MSFELFPESIANGGIPVKVLAQKIRRTGYRRQALNRQAVLMDESYCSRRAKFAQMVRSARISTELPLSCDPVPHFSKGPSPRSDGLSLLSDDSSVLSEGLYPLSDGLYLLTDGSSHVAGRIAPVAYEVGLHSRNSPDYTDPLQLDSDSSTPFTNTSFCRGFSLTNRCDSHKVHHQSR